MQYPRGKIRYNSTKAGYLTRHVCNGCLEIDFFPISGMSQEEGCVVLGRSAAYLDLGAHPGEDRIPREAALCGCVSSVALRGAGAYSDDIPIPFRLKIRVDGYIVEDAVGTLSSLANNRQSSFDAQSTYRGANRLERETLAAEINAIFLQCDRGFDTRQRGAFASKDRVDGSSSDAERE